MIENEDQRRLPYGQIPPPPFAKDLRRSAETPEKRDLVGKMNNQGKLPRIHKDLL